MQPCVFQAILVTKLKKIILKNEVSPFKKKDLLVEGFRYVAFKPPKKVDQKQI